MVFIILVLEIYIHLALYFILFKEPLYCNFSKVIPYLCNLLSNSSTMLFPHNVRDIINANNAIKLAIIVKIGFTIIFFDEINITIGIKLNINIINW